MRAALLLAINRLSARPSRSVLLVAAVALSAALITVVSSAMASLNSAIRARLDATVGASDIVLKVANASHWLDDSWVERIEQWEGVEIVSPERQLSKRLVFMTTALVPKSSDSTSATKPLSTGGQWVSKPVKLQVTPVIHGIDPSRYQAMHPVELLVGHMPTGPGEIVIDVLLAQRLSWSYQSQSRGSGQYGMSLGPTLWKKPAPIVPESVPTARQAERINQLVGVRLGDTVSIDRLLRRSMPLKVVGIASQPPLGGRPQAYMTLDTLAAAIGGQGKLSALEIVIDETHDPETIASTHQADLPGDGSLVLETTARVSANVERNLASSQLGLILATVLAFLTAGFIIFTGLTVDAAQQQRELAMLRCIGATRKQLSLSQLYVGFIVGVSGAIFGIALGLVVSGLLVHAFREQIPQGTVLSWLGIVLSLVGSSLAGIAGAAWPAYRASRSTPIEAMGSLAKAPGRTLLGVALLVAVMGLGVHLSTFLGTHNSQIMFWTYATIGLPAIFVGYFFLSIPLVQLLSHTIAPVLIRLCGVPRGMVERFVAATPVRYGFTAGAMMAGLALMIALWTQGGALLRDWLEKLEFPDAFVSGLSIPPQAQQTLEDLPFVDKTCAITMYPVETDAFGVHALQQYYSTFIAFEPEAFFDMANLTWIEGDPDQAIARLQAGDAVIVAKEFQIAQGLGVGDVFTCQDKGKTYTFDIVGVVTSPGLDIVSKFFDIGEEYTHQALHAVFGSRKDLKQKFNADTINLIQIQLNDAVSDDQAIDQIWEAMAPYGIMDAGSGRQILSGIVGFIHSILLATSVVALINMLIASLGVANIIIHSVEQRRYELGVLRAVGAQRGLLMRMIAVETVIIAVTASILGTLMGTQLSWAAQHLHRALLGIEWNLKPPLMPILMGSGVVLVICLLASVPAVFRLNRAHPCELLGR